MMKYIFGIVALIVVLGGLYYFLKGGKSGSVTPPPGPGTQQNVAATTTYSGDHFSAVYPTSFTVDPSFQNTEVSAKKPIPGVKFTIPESMATGTNLGSDTYLSVEWLEHAKKCTADIYLKQNVKTKTIDDNGMQYSFASSTGAAAGNMYEELVYAIPESSPCTAVRYFIHSGNIGNYSAGSVQEFNRDQLLAAFDAIRRSVQLSGAPASTPAASGTPPTMQQ